MNFNYRNERNAKAISAYYGKPLDKKDWYEIKNSSSDEAEIIIFDYIGWPFNDPAALVRSLAELDGENITVRINSPGGDVFDGISIFNALQGYKGKVTTRIEALSASIASVISLSGKVRQAYQNTMMMIHEPYVYSAGNQYELRETADILEKISGNMVDIYSQNTNVGKREIKDMLKAETWLSAKEMKDKGFIDTIIDGKAAKAQFDLSMFAHAPDGISADHEPTEREKEKALRDVGLTLSEAKAFLAGRRKGESIEEITAAQNLLKIIGGK